MTGVGAKPESPRLPAGLEGKSPKDFWEDRFERDSGATTGKPTHTLETHAADRTPGKALDLGCARGDDVVWLAKRGWQVLGVDIAEAALNHTRANLVRNDLESAARLERHNLDETFPDGDFDLVTASFLHSPFALGWSRIIRQAAAAIRPGGLLLTVTHQRLAPWSWNPTGEDLPDARTLLASLGLDSTEWREIQVGAIDRIASGPGGQTAPVTDAVIALERRNDPA